MNAPRSNAPHLRASLALPLLVSMLLIGGCASLASSAGARLAERLSAAIMDQNDPETVRDGAPAYLLLMDGLIEDEPDSERFLRAGARLYGAYAAVFVDDPLRARRLADKSLAYVRRAMCLRHATVCDSQAGHFEAFAAALAGLDRGDVPLLYDYATVWAGWVDAHRDDWAAIAELPKVGEALERVVALDEGHERGGAHLYLGILKTLLPEAAGGRPEEGRAHFERAVELSTGRNLGVKVEFARRYARLTFDRELHDRLLSEVLAADPQAPGLTLLNTIAQRQARLLLDSAASYF